MCPQVLPPTELVHGLFLCVGTSNQPGRSVAEHPLGAGPGSEGARGAWQRLVWDFRAARAAMVALRELRTHQDTAKERGIPLEQIYS